jgi:hypothetical protein
MKGGFGLIGMMCALADWRVKVRGHCTHIGWDKGHAPVSRAGCHRMPGYYASTEYWAIFDRITNGDRP